MNKTITSNIAGYVFHIDENAFDKLDAYLNTIRSYFKDSQGKDDIIADIEARLAEMLQERIGDAKQVVTLDDVNHVIQIMGRPEAFLEDDSDTAEWAGQKSVPRSETTRRLFRDPDNRVIGGVCAGVSNYLGLDDPIWLRLALVISFFFFGTGFLLYLILWIIMPEAVTTADKLQMRGENVTVSNIEKKVNEELETVKNKWNDLNGNNRTARKVGNAFHRAITLIGSLITMLLNFLSKIIGFVLLFTGIIGFLAMLTIPLGLPTMISVGNDGVVSSAIVPDIMYNMVGGSGTMSFAMIAGMLVWGIPLLFIAFIGSKLLFRYKGLNKSISLTLMGLWIIGIVMSLTVATTIASDFTSEGSDTETIELPIVANSEKAIVLALNHELGDDEPKTEAEIFDLELMTAGNSTKLYGKPELDIKMAKTTEPKLIIKRQARAKRKQDAMERASKITYGFVATDTSILFNGYFEIPEDELWRTQDVELELLLPVGYSIYLSDELRKIICDIDNVTNTYDGDMLGRRWMMTSDGLTCVDCEGIDNDWEEKGDEDDLIERELEEKQRMLELEQERFEREMEERQRELEDIEEQLEQNSEEGFEEASESSKEIILKRVINATYWVDPTTFRNIRVSYPG